MSFGKFKHRGMFVTATDTSVGKTTVAAGLVGHLRKQGVDVGIMKPVASGAIECDSGKLISQDAEMLVKFSGATDPWECINPYCLATVATPSLAAKIEGVTIDFSHIKTCFEKICSQHDFVVVEGAGGVMSPIFEDLLVVDVIKTLALPAVIVSRSSLGTINHTVMSYECMKVRGLECLGFFFNRFPKRPNLAESTNAEIISSISGLPHLGSIPDFGDFFSSSDVIEGFANSVDREKLVEVLCE